MDRLIQDVRLALRLFARAPAFGLVAVLTLGLGIGATTTVFSIVDGSILRPFPYPDMDRFVWLTEISGNGQPLSVSWLNFQDWRAQADVFDELGLFRGMTVTYTGTSDTDRLNASLVSSSVFDTVGIRPLAGRVFTRSEDEPTTPPVAVVSERLWRSRFGADPSLVNRDITLDGRQMTVVGIMPAAMRFPSRLTDVWLPMGLYVNGFPTGRGAHPSLTAVGRLKRGVTVERARATMATIAARLSDQYPNSNHNSGVVVTPYYDLIVQNIRPAMLMALAAVGLLLLITCANLASLVLARAEARQHEMTIRAALGAGRGRLIRQIITEALVLSLIGGAIGLLLAQWGVGAFVATRPTTIPRIDLLGINWRVVVFAIGATLATGILVGIAPALRTSRPDVQSALKDGTRSVGRGSTRFRSGLVAAELALATVLLVGAALLAKSFARLSNTELGFRPGQVVTMRVSLPTPAYPSIDSWVMFHRTLIDRLAQRTGLGAVGLSSSVPLNGGAGEASMLREGDPPPAPDRPSTTSSFHVVSAGYFAALGVPIARGRAFDARDTGTTTPVVMIDDRSAERLFPNENPIGRRISFELRGDRPDTFDPIWREVVGVVPHIRYYGLATEPPYVQLFVPYTQLPIYSTERRPAMALVVRAQGEAAGAIAAVRETVRTLDPSIPVYALQPLSDYLDQAGEQSRLNATLIGGFALLALVLAVVGVYGVLSYAVTRRTREIGLRVALGATSGDVMRLVGGQALRLIVIGLTAGAAAAVAASRLVAGLLVGVSPHDPLVFVIVLAVLAMAATLASLLPIRRAAAVDPQLALRAE